VSHIADHIAGSFMLGVIAFWILAIIGHLNHPAAIDRPAVNGRALIKALVVWLIFFIGFSL